jgi:hypothetical protein
MSTHAQRQYAKANRQRLDREAKNLVTGLAGKLMGGGLVGKLDEMVVRFIERLDEVKLVRKLAGQHPIAHENWIDFVTKARELYPSPRPENTADQQTLEERA